MKPKKIPTKIEIIGAFSKALDKLGVKTATVSEMNAIIKAATLVHDELRRDKVGASASMGLAAWCRSDDTGLSSTYMAWVLSGRNLPAEPRTKLDAFWIRLRPHPLDVADFGRCYRLLRAAPELRERLDLMRQESPVWAALVDEWADIETLYDTGDIMAAHLLIRKIIDRAEEGQ